MKGSDFLAGDDRTVADDGLMADCIKMGSPHEFRRTRGSRTPNAAGRRAWHDNSCAPVVGVPLKANVNSDAPARLVLNRTDDAADIGDVRR